MNFKKPKMKKKIEKYVLIYNLKRIIRFSKPLWYQISEVHILIELLLKTIYTKN